MPFKSKLPCQAGSGDYAKGGGWASTEGKGLGVQGFRVVKGSGFGVKGVGGFMV